MSVDDSALRDPRVMRLAMAMKITRREALGSLLCVWAVCYDRVTVVLPAEDVDIASELAGFAGAMVAVGLADDTPDGMRIRGAEDRIGYLERQAERGRKGGIQSGMARTANSALAKAPLSDAIRNRSVRFKQRFEANEAPSKPPDSASASAPVPDSSPDPASAVVMGSVRGETAPPSAPLQPKRAKQGTRLDEDWKPGPALSPEGVDTALEWERFRDWCRARGQRYVDWQAAWRNWLRKAGEFAARQPKKREDGLSWALRMVREGAT